MFKRTVLKILSGFPKTSKERNPELDISNNIEIHLEDGFLQMFFAF